MTVQVMFNKMIQNVFTMPWAAVVLFIATTLSLVFAYVAETFFGVAPCELCIYQRVPFAIVMVIALFGLAVKLPEKQTKYLLIGIASVLYMNAALAFYHTGVELHWWAGTDGCAVNPVLFAGDTEAMRQMLLATSTVRCDEINFTFLGLTMANWNIIWCLDLGSFALISAYWPRLKHTAFVQRLIS